MSLGDRTRTDLVERRRVILMADLAGFTRAVARLEALDLARLIDDFYVSAAAAVESHGGIVVKFIGDGCLALFDDDCAPGALRCVEALDAAVRELGRDHGIDLDLGANVHLAVVVEGEFGTGASRAHDVISPGVIHAFRMGSGPGVRISEPVYRQLPSGERGPWKKHQPPATYTLSA